MTPTDRDELVEAIHASPFRAVLAITGGGAGAIERLLRTPGASRTVLEAVVPYDPGALAEWIAGTPERACSEATARRMAMAAFQRARRLAGDVGARELIGVGCTAALATDRSKRGEHRVHVAAHAAARTIAVELILEKGRRTRAEEEAVAAHAVVATLADSAGVRPMDLASTPPGIEPSRRESRADAAVVGLLLGERRGVALNGAEAAPALLLPGSFNPSHRGHAEMMQVAEHRTGLRGVFELSMTNVDKPPLDYLDLESRLAGLGNRPTLLTNASRFADKAELAPGAVFAIGADTAARIVDAAYYGGDLGARDAAIQRLGRAGCRFLVFGREIDGRFQELESLDLPPAFAALCDGVPDEEFRRDISSTAIRAEEPPPAS